MTDEAVLERFRGSPFEIGARQAETRLVEVVNRLTRLLAGIKEPVTHLDLAACLGMNPSPIEILDALRTAKQFGMVEGSEKVGWVIR